MTDDNIIRFPGAGAEQPEPETTPSANGRVSPAGDGHLGMPGLTEDQEKAIEVILSGMSFVCVGIKPTGSGADFFTAIDGDASDISNAGPHLDGVIQRALLKRNL